MVFSEPYFNLYNVVAQFMLTEFKDEISLANAFVSSKSSGTKTKGNKLSARNDINSAFPCGKINSFLYWKVTRWTRK